MVEPALGLWISTAGVGSDGAFQAGNAPYGAKRIAACFRFGIATSS
jgi:hypothetical protein